MILDPDGLLPRHYTGQPPRQTVCSGPATRQYRATGKPDRREQKQSRKFQNADEYVTAPADASLERKPAT
jgi:hypothetical protein